MPNVTVERPAETAAREALEAVYRCLEDGTSFRLEAGAGAGKTYSLVKALQKLIDERGATYLRNRQRIACITYTNVAKDEIDERTDGHAAVLSDTIHGFCWSLLAGFQKVLRETLPTIHEKWAERLDEAGGIGERNVAYDLGFAGVQDESVTLSHDDVLALMVKFLALPKFRRLLVARYPVIFIDEYQDMNDALAGAVVEHLLAMPDGPQIGLFGDHWQRIYGDGCGLIEHDDLVPIGKKANFRSVPAVVDVLNNMRPELPQAVRDESLTGEARVFHTNSWSGARETGAHTKGDLPPEEAREAFDRVRERLVADGWEFAAEKTKVLMLTHKILAGRQGYSGIAEVFSKTSNDSYIKKEDPHISFLLDHLEVACASFEEGRFGAMFEALGSGSPRLQSHAQKTQWHDHLQHLVTLRQTGSIGDIIESIQSEGLIRLPTKMDARERAIAEDTEDVDSEEARPSWFERIPRLKAVPYQEVIELGRFIDGYTPFATKHGVKGAEFENVLVVVGRGWNQYNFDQMLSWIEGAVPSGKEKTFERSRNLFYVACSRPMRRLAVLFTHELSSTSIEVLKRWFGQDAMIDAMANT